MSESWVKRLFVVRLTYLTERLGRKEHAQLTRGKEDNRGAEVDQLPRFVRHVDDNVHHDGDICEDDTARESANTTAELT
jgi:hypothetical protein